MTVVVRRPRHVHDFTYKRPTLKQMAVVVTRPRHVHDFTYKRPTLKQMAVVVTRTWNLHIITCMSFLLFWHMALMVIYILWPTRNSFYNRRRYGRTASNCVHFKYNSLSTKSSEGTCPRTCTVAHHWVQLTGQQNQPKRDLKLTNSSWRIAILGAV